MAPHLIELSRKLNKNTNPIGKRKEKMNKVGEGVLGLAGLNLDALFISYFW